MRAVLAVALAGCFPTSPYECDRDVECSEGEVCARTHECVLAGQVRGLRLTWTVQGDADVAAACPAVGLGDLTLAYGAPDGRELVFAPVACTLGLYAIDKLPTWFDRVELSGYGAGGALFSGSAPIGPGPDAAIDL